MKLLVNAPCGAQEIIEISESGGYFDSSRVLWDERTDGPMPNVQLGGMVRVNGALEVDSALLEAAKQASDAKAIAKLLTEVDSIAKQKRDSIVANISPAEMASWPIKRGEALDYTSSGLEQDAPTLSLEAQARGITLADMVHKVLTKAAQLSSLEVAIAGLNGKYTDQIKAAASVEEANAIDITQGWPV